MKLAIHYVNDSKGKVKAVQLPLNEWRKVRKRLIKYEQTLKVKSDLTAAFSEVIKIKNGEIRKHTLSDFLNEI